MHFRLREDTQVGTRFGERGGDVAEFRFAIALDDDRMACRDGALRNRQGDMFLCWQGGRRGRYSRQFSLYAKGEGAMDSRTRLSVSRPVSSLNRRKSLPTAMVPEVRIMGVLCCQSVCRNCSVRSETVAQSIVPPRSSSAA